MKDHLKIENMAQGARGELDEPAEEKHVTAAVVAENRLYTIDELKEAYADGFYEGAGDDLWYHDHDNGELTEDASVHRHMTEYLECISTESDPK